MIRLILADDEIETRNNIVNCIDWEANGLEIAGVADNGDQALDLIREARPDVAIVDIYMPGCNGLSVIEQCRRDMENPPVFIIISGYNEFTYAQQAIRLKVEEYILKPFRPRDLLGAVRRAVWQAEAAKSSEPNDFYSFLRVCQTVSHMENAPHAPYASEAERKVLSAIAVGSREDVAGCLDAFMDQCVYGQPVIHAVDHAEMLRIGIRRLLMERCKDLPEEEPSTGQAWNFDNVYGQLAAMLRNTAYAANEHLAVSRQRSALIMAAVAYIEEHYTEDITLEQVASSIFVSPPYLSNQFREKMGINLVAYIHKVRIEKAKELLLHSELSISNIAEMVGYNGDKHFLQKFKQMNGITPSQFRFKKSD